MCILLVAVLTLEFINHRAFHFAPHQRQNWKWYAMAGLTQHYNYIHVRLVCILVSGLNCNTTYCDMQKERAGTFGLEVL